MLTACDGIVGKRALGEVGMVESGGGILKVTSYPEGAKVFVKENDDFIYMDHTPTILNGLTPGEKEVKITKEGYSDHVETVTVVEGDSVEVNAILEGK